MPADATSFPASLAHEELVEALQELHRATGLLSYRKISSLIKDRDDLPDSVSHEGVRTALKGERKPRWETVRSIVVVMAEQCTPPRDPQSEVARFLPLWRATRQGEAGAWKSAREFDLSGWGGEDGKWTPELVAGLIINPFNAIEIHLSLTLPHEPIISEDEWIYSAKRIIEENGVEFALRALLRILKGDYPGAEEGVPYGYKSPEVEEVSAIQAFRYGCSEILRRLRSEPNLLQKSVHAIRTDETISQEERAEILQEESDVTLLREVMTVTPETWHEVSEEAHHLVFNYLIKRIETIGPINLPPESRFRIIWRIPEEPQTP